LVADVDDNKRRQAHIFYQKIMQNPELKLWLFGIPIFVLSFNRAFEKNSITILTRGGLRGGISVALALSLNTSMYRKEFLAITYVVVIFSIVVQGLTIGKVARKLA